LNDSHDITELEKAWSETLRFKGPSGEYSFYELNQACSAVLSDTTDVENTGVVYRPDSNEAGQVIVKGNCAVARYILDGTIKNASVYETPDGLIYNVRFVAGDTTYLLDTESGYFSRERDSVTVLSKLEDDALRKVCIHLGVFDPDASE
jgi:hypothetical protein